MPLFDVGVEYQPIAPQAQLVWTMAAVGIATPCLLVLVAVLAAEVGPAAGAIGFVLSVAILALLRRLVVRRYRSWGYHIGDDELVLRRGLLLRRLTIVPIGRMQFVDIQQGPLDRLLGVANVQLHTAAAASDAKIPMLAMDVAGRVRDELTARGAGRSGGT
jgi:hypothetical protein